MFSHIQPDIITATFYLSLGEENVQTKEEFKPTDSKKLTNQQKEIVWKEIEASKLKCQLNIKCRLNYIAATLNIVEHENNDVDKKLQQLKEVEGVCTNEKCKNKQKQKNSKQ